MFKKTKKGICLVLVCVVVVTLMSGAVFAVNGECLAEIRTEPMITVESSAYDAFTERAVSLSSVTPFFIHPFTDVAGHWAYRYIEFVHGRNIMQGTSSTTFAPNGILTRAQMAQVLYNMEGRPSVAFEPVFSDVTANRWYSDAIVWAYNSDLVKGVGGGRFAPRTPITREQMVTILYRFAVYRNYDMATSSGVALEQFPDADQISHWATSEMRWAVYHGLIQGTSAGSLNPRGTATRAQIAVLLMRFIQRFEISEDFVLTISAEETTLPQGRNFSVYAKLENHSGQDIKIAYDIFTKFHPNIPGEPLRFDPVSPYRANIKFFGKDTTASQTVNSIWYYDLLPGIYEMTVKATFYLDWEQPNDSASEHIPWKMLDNARRIEVVSNTIELTVTKPDLLPTAEDFELAISVAEKTLPEGEDFVVTVELKNNSGQDLELAYDLLFYPSIPEMPWIIRIFPPPWPYVRYFENGSTISQTFNLNFFYDWPQVVYQLTEGTYQLTVIAGFYVGWEQPANPENNPIPWVPPRSAQRIGVVSNTISLTVTAPD